MKHESLCERLERIATRRFLETPVAPTGFGSMEWAVQIAKEESEEMFEMEPDREQTDDEVAYEARIERMREERDPRNYYGDRG